MTAESAAQNLLVANAGKRRVTIGVEVPEELRQLSDARALTCPACGAPVILHAGTVRAHHFAHQSGAACTVRPSEPETEEHRAGKLLIARWLRERLPEAEVLIEAFLPATAQRADVLAVVPAKIGAPRRIALEFQCANLTAREWRRRHQLYRQIGIDDLWLLGGSRLHHERDTPRSKGQAARRDTDEANEPVHYTLRTGDLERGMLWDGAPLLFLDAAGEHLAAETLARFRPNPETQAMRPTGRLSIKPLMALEFPWSLLDWPAATHPDAPAGSGQRPQSAQVLQGLPGSDRWLWEWLIQRFRVTPDTLPEFLGLPLYGQEGFDCEPRVWQAAVYYRFVHGRVGDAWWLAEVETWARNYIPLGRPLALKKIQSALRDFQEALGAAGMLSLPMGFGRVHARVLADLTTLSPPPSREETMRLVRYRRTLTREAREAFNAKSGPA